MSPRLAEPAPLAKTEFLTVDQRGSWSPAQVADRIYDSSRTYRKEHCAIFIDPDSVDDFLHASGLQVDFLDPDENSHWTGVQRPVHPKLKPILVGDYDEWFRWFMKWQRFNAFHIIVLINPIRRMIDDDRRGYYDGLLTRLLNKQGVHRIIIVEEERFQPTLRRWMGGAVPGEEDQELKAKFGQKQFRDAICSILYGTLLSNRNLSAAAASTLFSKVNPAWEPALQDLKRKAFQVARTHRWFYSLGDYGKEIVEGLETPAVRKTLEDPQQSIPPLFKRRGKRCPSELNQEWLEGLTQSLLDSQGWFTVAGLYQHVDAQTQRVIQTSGYRPQIFNDHFDDELPSEMHVWAPSRPLLRGIAERLAQEGKLQKATWVREIGRPTTVYHLPGQLPFDAKNRCGQCAFYVPLRRQCRIWWLLDKSYGSRYERWGRDGARPLSGFEIHKMRNSWRIGPHSSACSKFVDKKKDYSRLSLPELCDVCQERLPETPPKWSMVVCGTCRTRYFRLRQGKVKVLTSYEHEFEKRYHELAGVDRASDIKRLIEERQGSAGSIVEQAIFDERRHAGVDDPDSAPKTVMLFPGDRMLARDGRLYVFKRRNVESLPLAGSTIIDHGGVVNEEQRGALESAGTTVRSISKSPGLNSTGGPPPKRYDIAPAVDKVVGEYPEFLRRMSLAMVQSSIHATERVGSLAHMSEDDVQTFTRKQRMYARRLERAPPTRFLVYEALSMKEYWNCYYLVLKGAFQRFGPRKKARFVREFVTNPAGRARGYTAVDAAINYLHQRRFFKARAVNVQLGLDFNPGEGFLHRKRWNPEGLGLIFDLIDPFKFADREKLLGAILDVSVNWRDFYGATDRSGARFYYPKAGGHRCPRSGWRGGRQYACELPRRENYARRGLPKRRLEANPEPARRHASLIHTLRLPRVKFSAQEEWNAPGGGAMNPSTAMPCNFILAKHSGALGVGLESTPFRALYESLQRNFRGGGNSGKSHQWI